MNHIRTVEVCFSPVLYPYRSTRDDFIVVIADILRNSTTICAAIDYGVKEIIPVTKLDDARKYKEKGYVVAAERDGLKPEFADLGNSPVEFRKQELLNKPIVISTSNGTKAIRTATGADEILIGSFLNISSLTAYLKRKTQHLVILCSGWMNQFSLEDTLFAGAMVEKLLSSGFSVYGDSSEAALELWKNAQHDLIGYIDKASHRHRLRKLGQDDILEYTFTQDSSVVVPIFVDNRIIDINTK